MTHRHRPRHGDPARGQLGAVDRPLGPRAQHATCRCSSSCCSPRLGALGFGSILRRQVAGEAAGLPGALRAAGRASARRRRSTSTARPSTATTYVATLMHAAEQGRGRPDPRRERHLDDHRQGRAGGLGRARPGHHRHRAHPRRPGLVVHGQQEGRRRPGSGSRPRSSGSTAASRPGPRRRATWSAAASAASAACWCWPGFGADAGLRDLEPVLDDHARPDPRRASRSAAPR